MKRRLWEVFVSTAKVERNGSEVNSTNTEVDENGKRVKCRRSKSVMRSLPRFNYKMADRALPLCNRFLCPFPSCKLGPLVTWYLMKISIVEEDSTSSDLASEILLRILLARLRSSAYMNGDAEWLRSSTLAGFPTFCPMTFHLLASYSLIAASRAAL